jgi:hypothetical protein
LHVRPGGVPLRPTVTISPASTSSDLDQILLIVGVKRDEAVAVLDLDHLAVARIQPL